MNPTIASYSTDAERSIALMCRYSITAMNHGTMPNTQEPMSCKTMRAIFITMIKIGVNLSSDAGWEHTWNTGWTSGPETTFLS